MKTLTGIAASSGITVGRAHVHRPVELAVERREAEDAGAEMVRLQRALDQSREQISEIHARTQDEAGEDIARIFEAHLLILEDPVLLEEVGKRTGEAHVNVEVAWTDAIEGYASLLEGMEDEVMCARAADVRDVGKRVLRNMLGISEQSLARLSSPAVIVARDLTPSDTAQMDKEMVLGFCTASGGTTSHTAIMARILGIPAVVGLGQEIMEVKDGQLLVVDGAEGVVVVDPGEAVSAGYVQRQRQFETRRELAKAAAQRPAVTTDGHQVEVVANIGDVGSARSALEYGAEGVGLLRTEFLYLDRASLPGEEEQYAAYRAIADVMGRRPLVIRTLDIGGDKQLPYLDFGEERNPFLGWRAIRLCLERVDLFKTQLRAILRASHERNVKVMFPMIADVGEVRQAKKILAQVMAELESAGIPFDPGVQVGIMIETPAAALAADILAGEVDFFSIGTNDLIQYTMACDRTNEHISYLYRPLHPVILRLVKTVVDAGHRAGRWVGMCGEMAGESQAIPILLGLHLDEFSVNPSAVPSAKEIIRSLSLEESQRVAAAVLDLKTEAEVRRYVDSTRSTLPRPLPGREG